MLAVETMTGVDNHKVDALPVERVQEIRSTTAGHNKAGLTVLRNTAS
jgi:hypothetical protein